MSEYKTLFSDHGAAFLLPEKVGSSIRWTVSVSKLEDAKEDIRPTFNAEVAITDCTRAVTWSVYGGDEAEDMLVKIDNAIFQLKAARKSVAAARKVYIEESK